MMMISIWNKGKEVRLHVLQYLLTITRLRWVLSLAGLTYAFICQTKVYL